MDQVHRVGTEDNLVVEINRASEGDTLVLESGYHTIDSPISKDADYITIVGRGINNTIIRQTDDFPLIELVGMKRRGDRCTRWQFRDLTLQSGRETSSDIVRARYGGSHRFENVRFESSKSIGNGVFAEECWDVRFTNCEFSNGGDPDVDSADVYLYNGDYDMTNSLFFLNCTWSEVASHALYSDSSGQGKLNDRIYIANSKFRGYGRGGRIQEDPNQFYIDGSCRALKIVNCHFNWSLKGFVRNQNPGRLLQISNCCFEQYGDAALDVRSDDSIVANNAFVSGRSGSTAVRTRGSNTRIVGNHVSDENGFEIEGENTGIHGNAVRDAAENGITIAADHCSATGNVVTNPGRHAITVTGDSTIVSGNTCLDATNVGVRIADAERCLVTDNVIRSAGERGIASVGTSDRLLVDDNVVTESGVEDVALTGDHNEIGHNLLD